MGYYSRVSGDFTIVPPLTAQEVRQWPKFVSAKRPGGVEQPEVCLEVVETVEELEEGDLHTKQGVAVVPVEGDSEWSRSSTPGQLQQVVDAYPNHMLDGFFEFTGEDGERWRVYITKGKVVTVKPQIIWPASADYIEAWGK